MIPLTLTARVASPLLWRSGNDSAQPAGDPSEVYAEPGEYLRRVYLNSLPSAAVPSAVPAAQDPRLIVPQILPATHTRADRVKWTPTKVLGILVGIVILFLLIRRVA